MTDDFNELMNRLQGSLTQMADDPQAAANEFALPEIEGHASVFDDKIRVTMDSEGFRDLTIDPRAMRLSNAELAEQLLDLFNKALQDHNEKMMQALTEQHPSGDNENLQSELRQIQTQSVQAMKKYTDSLFDALGQVRRISEG